MYKLKSEYKFVEVIMTVLMRLQSQEKFAKTLLFSCFCRRVAQPCHLCAVPLIFSHIPCLFSRFLHVGCDGGFFFEGVLCYIHTALGFLVKNGKSLID